MTHVVITGPLSITRDEFGDRYLGGKYGCILDNTVTRTTDYLLTNKTNNTAKMKFAVKYGIEIINEKDFIDMIFKRMSWIVFQDNGNKKLIKFDYDHIGRFYVFYRNENDRDDVWGQIYSIMDLLVMKPSAAPYEAIDYLFSSWKKYTQEVCI